MKEKKFKLGKEQIVQLIPNMGGCIATDMITVEGNKVGYMYRVDAINDVDSGWRFFSGSETQEYIDITANSGVYAVNTIANYDPAVIPYLELPVGVELERMAGTDVFQIISG